MSLVFWRDYPEYVKPKDFKKDGAAYSGPFTMGWTTGTTTPPTVWQTGPLLSSDIPVGDWVVWAKVDDTPEHPVVPLGRITVR